MPPPRRSRRRPRRSALIFDNELDWADDTCTDGCIVDVLDEQLRFAARGFFNSCSKITVRVLTRDPSEAITQDFFRSRIEAAWRARTQLGFSDSCRVVFGETDGLPGLTVDKFAGYLSFQITCLGLESWKQGLIDILADLFHPLGIYERDDLPVREKKDFPRSKPASMAASRMSLKSASMTRACSSASRTGRKPVTSSTSRKTADASAPIAPQNRFGSVLLHRRLSVHAALYGAQHVTAVDVSEQALSLVRRNAALNGVEEKNHHRL